MVHIASADFMTRNTVKRVEVSITNPDSLEERLIDIDKIKEQWETITPVLNDIMKDIRVVLEGVQRELNEASMHRVVDDLSCRIKNIDSVTAKLRRKKREVSVESALETLHDVVGLRMICSYQDDVYVVLKAIKNLQNIQILKIKDYIRTPKKSGYRSIHIIVKIDNTPIGVVYAEIQLRTFAMNYWAKLEHQLTYKNESPMAEDLRKELKGCAIAISDIDKKFYKMRKKIEHLQ